MARRKPKVQDVAADKYTVDSGSDDSRRSGGFDPLLGYTAVGGAALTTGYIAGKATGVGARVVNKVKGETVLLHGSPVSKLKEIKPSLSPSAIREGYTTPEAYAVNPIKTRSLSKAWRDAADYAQLSGSGVKSAGGGSVYIVKGKTSGFTSQLDSPVVSSSKPLRVIKEYSAITGSSNFVKDLKRAGIKVPKRR